MDFFKGIYWLTCSGKSMYAGVYTSPQNVDLHLNVTELLSKCPEVESCYCCGQPDPNIKVTGWIGIHFDSNIMELQILIFDKSNPAHPEIVLKKDFPASLI